MPGFGGGGEKKKALQRCKAFFFSPPPPKPGMLPALRQALSDPIWEGRDSG
jgi:hypothetical protein